MNNKRNNFIEAYLQEKRIRIEKIDEMFRTPEYMSWLMNFTASNKHFTDNQWLHFPNTISKKDMKNIRMLDMFYEGIDNYSKRKNLPAQKVECGSYYSVEMNNIGFVIGKVKGTGVTCFCDRVPVTDKESFIKMSDIMREKKNDNSKVIVDDLNSLTTRVHYLSKQNVSMDYIAETVDDVLSNLSTIKNQDKVFIKK